MRTKERSNTVKKRTASENRVKSALRKPNSKINDLEHYQ